MIQLHRLEGFHQVALAGGYARAARQFPYPITQPAVHQQVRKLEADLGVKLFERIAKDRVRLTAAGRKLHEFCAPFFDELPQVLRSIEAMSFGGELRVDASGLVLKQLMPSWVKRLRKSRSDIQVDLQEIHQPDLDRLRVGAADLLVDYVTEVPSGFDARVVARAHVFLVLPSDHPLAKNKHIRLEQLAAEPFVSYHPQLPHHALQMRELGRRGIVPRRTLGASSVDTILGFVEAGLGFSLVPWLDAKGPRVRGVATHAYASEGSGVDGSIRAIWRASGQPHPLIEAALDAAPTL
jgi:DNA-binding transcriptional LysR family regulator